LAGGWPDFEVERFLLALIAEAHEVVEENRYHGRIVLSFGARAN
jgi:hypothetical protein